MHRGLIAGVLLLIAAVVAGIIVTTSSAGGGGGQGTYRFYTGVHLINQGNASRVFVENVGTKRVEVEVIFTSAGVKDRNTLIVTPGAQRNALGAECTDESCSIQAEIRSPSLLIAPSVRFVDPAVGDIKIYSAGDWIVFKGGKRVF
jgi:hypothetical protein